jgi:asparagine synthase (glutamine-hydrolysing)
MSAQFGTCNFDGKPVDPQELDRVRPVLAAYGPDAEGIFHRDNVGIIYRAFHTTKESNLENQPCVLASGVVITWDGRLDNRSQLIPQLGGELSSESSDLSIVASAYEHWGTDSFAKLIGDWAVSIWNPRSQSLILAKDFLGTRHLYYTIDKDRVKWSTILDPLVLFSEKTFALCEEYIAGWLSFFPAPHLTPYVGVDSVPPSSLVVLCSGRRRVKKYWGFDPNTRVRYQTDGEYEEHFRKTFAEAVRRRLRSHRPVLAELSGGVDSSSIVCVADTILAQGTAETPCLDTLSYYNDSEPNWNERPYFMKVEQKRGRTGCHIDVGAKEFFTLVRETNTFASTPGFVRQEVTEASRQFETCLALKNTRVVLSGIGGDEVTGGAPTPKPELMDLLAKGRLPALAHQLKVWALNKKRPWFHLLFEAAREFLPPSLVGVPKYMRPVGWLQSSFVRSHRLAITGYPSRVKIRGALPSFQDSLSTLDGLRRQVACMGLSSEPMCEQRYPYLDRDLLEFIYAIPRQQLVRPGQRRSLMRRALIGIVPDEILNRRRKAFVIRSPTAAIGAEWSSLIEMSQQMICTSLGIVDAEAFCGAVQRARSGQEVRVVVMMRTLEIESWLRIMSDCGTLAMGSTSTHGSRKLGENRVWVPAACPDKSSRN